MTVFNQIGVGGIVVAGCPRIAYVQTYPISFAANDVVFPRYKALKGVLEKIVIKKYRLSNPVRTGGLFHVMYIDTWNGLWNEDELISHEEAIELATIYWERQLALAEQIKAC